MHCRESNSSLYETETVDEIRSKPSIGHSVDSSKISNMADKLFPR